MTKSVDFSRHIDLADAALGRTWVHNTQKGSNLAARATGSVAAWSANLETCALSAFEWRGVPEEIDPFFIEWCLLHYGWGGLFDMSDDGTGYLAFSVGAFHGNYNMYFNPQAVDFMAFNDSRSWMRSVANTLKTYARGGVLSKPESVIMYDNVTRRPLMQIIQWYAKRLAQIDMVIDQNVAAQACPYIVTCDEEQQKAAQDEYMAVSNFAPVIIKKKATDPVTSIEVLNLETPFIANDLFDAQARTLNTIYTLLGVDNSFSSKKERLIVDEVNGNNEQVLLFRNSRLKMRKKFCEVANDVFGLSLDVAYSVEHDEDGNGAMSQSDFEGGEDDD